MSTQPYISPFRNDIKPQLQHTAEELARAVTYPSGATGEPTPEAAAAATHKHASIRRGKRPKKSTIPD